MTINKGNFSTSADGADIFTVTGANSPFTNYGNLGTSGVLASPIRGAANGVSITNRGTLSTSGDGSPGVTVGDAFGAHYNNVTVSNYGTISTTGNYVATNSWFAAPDGNRHVRKQRKTGQLRYDHRGKSRRGWHGVGRSELPGRELRENQAAEAGESSIHSTAPAARSTARSSIMARFTQPPTAISALSLSAATML